MFMWISHFGSILVTWLTLIINEICVSREEFCCISFIVSLKSDRDARFKLNLTGVERCREYVCPLHFKADRHMDMYIFPLWTNFHYEVKVYPLHFNLLAIYKLKNIYFQVPLLSCLDLFQKEFQKINRTDRMDWNALTSLTTLFMKNLWMQTL